MKTYVIGTDKRHLSQDASYEYPQHMFSWRDKKNLIFLGLKKHHEVSGILVWWKEVYVWRGVGCLFMLNIQILSSYHTYYKNLL